MNPTVSGSPQIPAPGRFHNGAPTAKPRPGSGKPATPAAYRNGHATAATPTGRSPRPDSRTAALLGDLGAAAEEIGRLRWTLQQVVILARRCASAD
jgi:hypothetical protein